MRPISSEITATLSACAAARSPPRALSRRMPISPLDQHLVEHGLRQRLGVAGGLLGPRGQCLGGLAPGLRRPRRTGARSAGGASRWRASCSRRSRAAACGRRRLDDRPPRPRPRRPAAGAAGLHRRRRRRRGRVALLRHPAQRAQPQAAHGGDLVRRRDAKARQRKRMRQPAQSRWMYMPTRSSLTWTVWDIDSTLPAGRVGLEPPYSRGFRPADPGDLNRDPVSAGPGQPRNTARSGLRFAPLRDAAQALHTNALNLHTDTAPAGGHTQLRSIKPKTQGSSRPIADFPGTS